jgi:hypothetical protein
MPNTSTFTQDMGVIIARQFQEVVGERANVYLAISRVEPFPDDSNPPTANSSVEAINNFWRNMIGGKKILRSDISLVIPRKNWEYNTLVPAYSSSSPRVMPGNISSGAVISSLPYVITDDFNVYKCLSNSNGANSTIKPISTNPATIYSTADGYIWKYMYTLSSKDIVKFLTPDWIPVRTLTGNDGSLQFRVQQAAIPGAIHVCTVTNPGSGYDANNPPTVTITGDGRGADAIATVNASTTGIDSVILSSYGFGYSYASVTFSGGGTAAARAEIEPQGGHGANPESELGGFYVMFNARLKGAEDGKLINTNDYRSYALLVNPYVYDTTNVFSGAAFSQTTDLTVASEPGGGNFAQDETVFQGPNEPAASFIGEVATFNSTNNIIRLINPEGIPVAGEITGANTVTKRFVTAISNPDLAYYTGSIIYKDNITPIVRNDSQTEDIKIVISCQLF